MAQQDFKVDNPSGVCAATGQPLQEGEEFFTVLFEEGEGFRRADYSQAGWQGPPEGSYCFFKSRVPVREKRRKRLLADDDVLVDFFRRLQEETEPVRVQFRFVLALILMRKRKLRYEGSHEVEGKDLWDMVLVSDQSRHRVLNPKLTDEQIDGVSRQLSAILHGDMAEWVDREENADHGSGQDTPKAEDGAGS